MHTEARACEIRSAVNEEPLPSRVPLLLAGTFRPRPQTAALHEELCDERFADAREAVLLAPIGDWQDAAALKYIVSGALPQLRARFAPA